MGTKTKIVLVVEGKELEQLRQVRVEQNAALRSAGILRDASLADAARSMMVRGLTHRNLLKHAGEGSTMLDLAAVDPEEGEILRLTGEGARKWAEENAGVSPAAAVAELTTPEQAQAGLAVHVVRHYGEAPEATGDPSGPAKIG